MRTSAKRPGAAPDVKIGPELERFLSEVMPALVGTARKDGSVQMKPVWFEHHDGQIWLNGGPNRMWVKRTKRTGRIALFFLDPKNMWRHALIHCRVIEMTTAGADEHIDQLSMRYLGVLYRNPKLDRLIVKLEPISVSGVNDRKPWS